MCFPDHPAGPAHPAVADLYRQRWQIETFFPWIKQDLKIKAFYGTSENAVLIQIWTSCCGGSWKSSVGWSILDLTKEKLITLYFHRPQPR